MKGTKGKAGAAALLALALLATTAAEVGAGWPAHDAPVRHLYLIRHGEYVRDEGCDEDAGCALDRLGRHQAALAGDLLASLGIEFTSLQSSSMTRARETAAIIDERLPGPVLELHRDIRECTPATRRADVMAGLEPGEAEACGRELAAAWDRLVRPAADRDAHDIVVCHGNVIRWFVCRALGVDPEAWLGMSIANCSLTVIQVRPDGTCRLVTFADAGHIPFPLRTYPGTVADPAAVSAALGPE
ncbi:MAG: histidine phosphatase family protein [Candidatus Latescibacteria bacterium]|nr:histidine phosphatase family protein [Candidatus Latescibacterota bacterium]